MTDSRRTVTVRLAPDVAERLERQADRRDVSVNLLVAKAVERALAGWEEQELP